MNDVFTSRDTRGKIESDQRKQLAARASDEVAAVGSRAPAGPSAHTQANADYLRDQAQAQAQLRKEQDQGLDKIGNTLDRLNEMAVTIDSELKEQDKILADIDTDMDSAQNKMDGAIKSVEKLLKTKDKCQLCVIAGLTLTFVIVAIITICACAAARRFCRACAAAALAPPRARRLTATLARPAPAPPSPARSCGDVTRRGAARARARAL